MENMKTLTFLGIFLVGWSFLGWSLSRVLRRNDLADILWGLGPICIAALGLCFSGPLRIAQQNGTVLVCTVLWGTRLALHLWLRMKGKPEDRRYAGWRKKWGTKKEPLRAYFQVFFLQTVLLVFVSFPQILTFWIAPELDWEFSRDPELSVLEFMGVGIFACGWIYETIADWQLQQFKKNPQNQGKTLSQGLWAYSRHPNYFGEVVLWWGMGLMVLGTPWGWLSFVLSSGLVSFLILRVSGVPMLERTLASDQSARKESYQTYLTQTSRFLPRFRSKVQ